MTFRQMMLRNGVADLMIRVHDTGAGMEPEFINRIFRPFEQESIEIGHRYGGTGLGMAITDQLVRLMGGEIVVESQPGKGSDFSVLTVWAGCRWIPPQAITLKPWPWRCWWRRQSFGALCASAAWSMPTAVPASCAAPG